MRVEKNQINYLPFIDIKIFDNPPIDGNQIYYFILLRHLIGLSNIELLNDINFSNIHVNKSIYDLHKIMVISKTENMDIISKNEVIHIIEKLRNKTFHAKKTIKTSLRKLFLFANIIHYYDHDSINHYFQNSVVEYILSLKNNMGVYRNSNNSVPTIGATFDALLLLDYLKKVDEIKNETIEWIESCQNKGFKKNPEAAREYLSATFDGTVLALHFNFIEKVNLSYIEQYVEQYFEIYLNKNKPNFKSLFYLFMINQLLYDRKLAIFDYIYWGNYYA